VKVAFVTPEMGGLVRRTSLAELSERLPRAIRRCGKDVRVFLPATVDVPSDVLEQATSRGIVTVRDGDREARFRIVEASVEDLTVYLFQNDGLFSGRHPYGDEEGPYADNWRRYAAFSRAMLESLDRLGFAPDVIHCVDWTTGLIPLFHQLEYVEPDRDHPATRAGTWFGVHNLAMQGVFEREVLPLIGIPHRVFQHVHGLELGGKVNFVKAGCEFATILGTHSPGHAARIQEQDRGYGLEETFARRTKELVGITNGIDYAAWDPSRDPLLPQTFSKDDKDLAGKRKCKATLQQSLGLDSGPRTPVAAMIGRFDADSGFDLVAEVLTPILERNLEIVLMGAGQPEITKRFKTMESTFAGRCRVLDGYDAASAHVLMGGADLLLLPSHYAPGNALCAIGMRYGVVPIVYEQSGLDDYVIDVTEDEKKGTGITFSHYTGEGLLEGVDAARRVYREAALWKKLASRCLAQDFSWESTASEYLKAYRRVTRRVRAGSRK